MDLLDMERDILRHHCLWQKTWTGPPSLGGSPPMTSFAWNLTARDSSSSQTSNLSKLSKIKKQVTLYFFDLRLKLKKKKNDSLFLSDFYLISILCKFSNWFLKPIYLSLQDTADRLTHYILANISSQLY